MWSGPKGTEAEDGKVTYPGSCQRDQETRMPRQETSVLPETEFSSIAQAGPERMFSCLSSLSSDITAVSHRAWCPSAWDKKIVFTPDREGQPQAKHQQ